MPLLSKRHFRTYSRASSDSIKISEGQLYNDLNGIRLIEATPIMNNILRRI